MTKVAKSFNNISIPMNNPLSPGKAADTRTNEQKVALLRLLRELKSRYPRALITSHHTFDAQKACPCFEAEREYGML